MGLASHGWSSFMTNREPERTMKIKAPLDPEPLGAETKQEHSGPPLLPESTQVTLDGLFHLFLSAPVNGAS